MNNFRKLLPLSILATFAVVASTSVVTRADETQTTAKVDEEAFKSVPLSLATTNSQVLRDVQARVSRPLTPAPNDTNVARLVAYLLERSHYSGQKIDASVSSAFFDQYLKTIDSLKLHFFQSDLKEFEPYRTKLGELVKEGDVTPAYKIFTRGLERLEQRVAYVADLLEHETFEFAGDDRYNLNRKDVSWPKDIEEAKVLWKQHLRYEILQEKLAKEKPDEIAKKITRRYARLLRTFKDFDAADIFEFYLSSLTRIYDPHSDYMGKSAYESFSIGMKLSLFGIGAMLTSEDGYCKILSLVEGGPASKSKQLKVNDKIIAVAQGDNEPVDVVDMKLNKVVEMIRGPKGTEVRLTVIPSDAPDPSVRRVIALNRDEIKLEDQEAKAKVIDLPGQGGETIRLGLIDLPSFYADFDSDRKPGAVPKSTTADVRKLVEKLKRENVKGIILDLRRNGGGSLEEAINLTGLFIKDGPVVLVKEPNGRITTDSDQDESIIYDGPLVVLTSRFSASASEILAGAIQDYGRGLVVGEKSTHGKGTVQSLINLDPYLRSSNPSAEKAGALKLTIRKFYRPSGSSTQLKGVVPDIVLPSKFNVAEVGEEVLDNAMEWDTTIGKRIEKLNRVQPYLADLQKRSTKRVESDKDFQYVFEDIEETKKLLADRSVSLNERIRLREMSEAETRNKAREKERKDRHDKEEIVYDITLKDVMKDGLPEPAKHKEEAKKEVAKDATAANDDGAEAEEGEQTTKGGIDSELKEAKRILVDYISLLSSESAIAATN